MRDVIAYIHGVTPEEAPGPHASIFQQLHQAVASLHEGWPADFLPIEWGWSRREGTPRSEELLSQAQRQLGKRMLPTVASAKDFSINPGRLAVDQLREINFFGFSDMFYYCSESGKHAIRRAVCEQLAGYMNGEEEPIRITWIGHSAGAVIAQDLLFHLYSPDELLPNRHAFVGGEGDELALQLRELAQSGQLLLRRLVTLGNPLGVMSLRHDRVLETLAAGEGLNPAHYGCVVDEELPGPRWMNIWDRDDPLAWPVEPLFHTGNETVKDVYVNVSDWITRAHNSYWSSKAVHKAIAERW